MTDCFVSSWNSHQRTSGGRISVRGRSHMSATRRQVAEARIQLRRHVLRLVVVREDGQGRVPFRHIIDGTRRQFFRVNLLAGNVPVDFFYRRVVGDPGFDPAVETSGDEFIRLVGVPRSQWLEMMECPKIPNGPGSERCQRNYADDDSSD